MRPEDIVNEIDQALEEAMDEDDDLGATGEWVAVLGFSQGAKVAASLLYRQQVREEYLGPNAPNTNFRFGILLAGRAPLVCLDPRVALNPPLADASQMTDIPLGSQQRASEQGDHILRIPTIHMHGRRDKGIALHRQLFEEFCDPYTRRLVEWDGEHRLPLKFKDVALVVHEMRELARETGIY